MKRVNLMKRMYSQHDVHKELGLDPNRLQEQSALSSLGTHFPSRFDISHDIGDLRDLPYGSPVRVAGRIREIDPSRGTLTIWDATGKVSASFTEEDQTLEEFQSVIKYIRPGDFIGLEGHLQNMDDSKVIIYSRLVVLSKSLRSIPDPSEWSADPKERGNRRYLDLLINPELAKVLNLRARCVATVRKFLSDRRFIEVETPILLSVADLSEVEQFSIYDRSGQELFLRICHEDRLKRLIIGGFNRVYELGKSFRKEQRSWKHSPEFLQLECVQAFANYLDMMELTETLIRYVVEKSVGTTRFHFRGEEIDLDGPWSRMTVREAVQKYAGIDIGDQDDPESLSEEMKRRGIHLPSGYYEWYNLVNHLIDLFVEPNLIQPTIILDYPAMSNYYARRKSDNSDLIERFEVYIGTMEIANGYSLVTDPVDFRKRLDHSIFEYHMRNKKTPARDDDLVTAKTYGLPPCAIVGLGIDRIIMLVTDRDQIDEVQWFSAVPS